MPPGTAADVARDLRACDSHPRRTTLTLVALTEAPRWFGEIALIDGGLRTHNANAREANTLLWLARPVRPHRGP